MSRNITIQSLPILQFAHSCRIEDYQNELWAVKDSFEITYVSVGELQVTQNGITYCAGAGDFICYPKTDDLTVKAIGMSEHYTASFDMQFIHCRLPLVIHATSAIHAHALMAEIVRTHILFPDQEYKISGLFLQLINELELLLEQASESYSYTPYIKQIKDYIYAHIHEPIKQGDIAAHLGITPEYLCNIFKQSEGVPLIPYINRIKLENMRTLIENKDFTLQQAAVLYGYTDPNYVSRLYKKTFGQNITTSSKPKKSNW